MVGTALELLIFRAFSCPKGCLWAWFRAERERRGISIDTIASVTKVGADLWEGLERNDFSRWPSGIFARAFVRDYARAIGLDADEAVDEFCRLFPMGDRRRQPLDSGAGATHWTPPVLRRERRPAAQATGGQCQAATSTTRVHSRPAHSASRSRRPSTRQRRSELQACLEVDGNQVLAGGRDGYRDVLHGMTIAFGTSPGSRP